MPYISGIGEHAAPLVIYDYHPDVIVRANWLAPWRHRRYFPMTGEQPELGRAEDLSANTRSAPEPAESFQRVWSTSLAFVHEERKEPAPDKRAEHAEKHNRVIHADAEVTILGPDRISIRLFRKRQTQ
jgi:beta-glucanase (GH16 family)